MDDRAFDQLVEAQPEIQKAFLHSFKPRREGEDDYSGLAVSFLRSVITNREKKGSDKGGRDKGGGRGPREGGSREGGRGRSREGSRERSRSPRGQGSRRDLSPLSAFRERYPIQDSAFKQLTSAPEEVRERVMADFKPRREGEKDYSGLVIAFVRAVTERLGSGKDRDRNNSPDRQRKDDGSDHRDSPDRRRKSARSEGSESPKADRGDGLKDASGSPGRGGEDDGKDKRKEDEVSIASSQGQPEVEP